MPRESLLGASSAVLVLAVVLGGCLPESVGSGRTASDRPVSGPPTPSPAPTGPTPSPSFVRPTPTPMPTFLSYVVARGDSLNTIAHRYGTTARSIAFWNRATYHSLDPESSRYAPNSIKVGWTLVLIPGVVFDENNQPDATDTPVPTASF
jgi:hypothetical protein